MSQKKFMRLDGFGIESTLEYRINGGGENNRGGGGLEMVQYNSNRGGLE